MKKFANLRKGKTASKSDKKCLECGGTGKTGKDGRGGEHECPTCMGHGKRLKP